MNHRGPRSGLLTLFLALAFSGCTAGIKYGVHTPDLEDTNGSTNNLAAEVTTILNRHPVNQSPRLELAVGYDRSFDIIDLEGPTDIDETQLSVDLLYSPLSRRVFSPFIGAGYSRYRVFIVNEEDILGNCTSTVGVGTFCDVVGKNIQKDELFDGYRAHAMAGGFIKVAPRVDLILEYRHFFDPSDQDFDWGARRISGGVRYIFDW